MHVIYCYVIRRVLCRYFDFTVRDILFVALANVSTRFHKLRFRQMQKHNDCISNLRLNMETKSQETLWVRQMHLDVYRRASRMKRIRERVLLLRSSRIQEKPFRFASVSEMQKGVSQNTDVSGKRKKRLLEWKKNRIYREFSSRSKTLFPILKGSLNSKSCQVRLEIICFQDLDRVSSTKARIIYYYTNY